MAPGRASRAERVCMRCTDVEQPLHLGTPSPRSHAARTIVLPCARRLASTSSRVVYSNQLAPRLLLCPAALGTAFPSCARAARRECFPCGPEVVLGSRAAGLGPLPHSRRDAGHVCRATPMVSAREPGLIPGDSPESASSARPALPAAAANQARFTVIPAAPGCPPHSIIDPSRALSAAHAQQVPWQGRHAARSKQCLIL